MVGRWHAAQSALPMRRMFQAASLRPSGTPVTAWPGPERILTKTQKGAWTRMRRSSVRPKPRRTPRRTWLLHLNGVVVVVGEEAVVVVVVLVVAVALLFLGAVVFPTRPVDTFLSRGFEVLALVRFLVVVGATVLSICWMMRGRLEPVAERVVGIFLY